MYLSDYFIELIALVTHFLRADDSRRRTCDELRADIDRLLSEKQAEAMRDQVTPGDFDLARFAICAWIDEMILSSSWSEKDKWMNLQLQKHYYKTTDAGELFFERLNALGPHQLEVREVYYLCLVLGLTGRYFRDEYGLEQIKTANLKLLMGSSLGLPSLERVELFPEAYPGGDADVSLPGKKRGRLWLMAVAGAVPVVLFAVLFIIYFFILDNVGENYLRMLLK